MIDLEFKKAEINDLALIRDILKRNYLVFRDIKDKQVELFMAYEQDRLLGIIGLEKFDKVGLLRSFVVVNEYRDKGYGREICNLLIKQAKDEGINELYLLTTTARKFFEKTGFEIVKRKDVPLSIKNTNEFSNLCPESAICMRKEI